MSGKSKSREPRLTPHARMVLERRYIKRDALNRVIETPAQMFERVAVTVARADEYYVSKRSAATTAARFYDMMVGFDFLPNSPALMNAGRELGQLSACFVLPIEDSIESIFNAVRDTALIHKSGGGTGFSFSRIRPANDLVKTTLGVSSGPISFMNVFDVATETIKQGGVRRGANMGILSVHHPDIMDFITVKSLQPGRFPNFNLSTAVTDDFMEAARAGRDYDLISPYSGKKHSSLNAGQVFQTMVEAAWACGDPGLVFIDRINEKNTLPHLGPIEATNPCGEQPLLPYESCTLGSVNLSRFAAKGKLDYKRLGRIVRQGVHFLDNVIDINRYPLLQIEEITKSNRKIGLGVMGLADAFIRMGIGYDSEQAIEFCRQAMTFIDKEAKAASAELAKKRGSFPNFKGSTYQLQGYEAMRNATTTTIAPTGSISIIAGCSSGIEPLFALAYRRRVLGNRELTEVHHLFKRRAKKAGLWNDDLAGELARTGGIGHRGDLPAELKRIFITAHEIDPITHLKIQAAFQEHTDNAVSKTVNLPQNAPSDVVRDIFISAFDMGLKGVTVYRDRSKSRQVLSFGLQEANPSPQMFERNGPDGPCPECGNSLEAEEGCWLCRHCGYAFC